MNRTSPAPEPQPHARRARASRPRAAIPLVLAAVALAAAASFALPAGASGGARRAATHAVTLSNFSFHPATLTIRRGDSVTWSWRIPRSEHNVTFRGAHSRTGSSGSFTLRFARAGTFSYVCTVHVSNGMRGKVIVR